MNATVKRKFNNLLHGIGQSKSTNPDSPSSTTRDNDSLTSTPASTSSSRFTNMANDSLDYLSKKRRVGGLPSTPSAITLTTPTKGQGQTTIQNVTLRKWNSHAGPASTKADSPVTKLQPPKYCPGDRDQLVRRLATFQELTDWTPKPDRVNEIEWAKRGWVCQGKERVKCTLCNNEIAVKINRKEVDGKEIPVLIASDIAESVVDQYAELIITSHKEDCLWRKKGCDDSLLRLPLPNPKLALETLRQRYDELCQRKDFLPYEFNLRLPQGLDIDTILSYLPPNFFTEPSPSSATTSQPASPNPSTSQPQQQQQPPIINRTALALALLGWQGLSNPRLGTPVPNSASCHTCLRRLGLWMFKSKQVDLETNTILVPAPMDHLDPLREHRFFCPWKNPQAQRNPGAKPLARGETDKAAWEVLVEGLRNESRLREKGRDLMHGRSKSSGFGFGLGSRNKDKGTPHRATGSASGLLGVPMTPDGRGSSGLQPSSAPGGLHVGGDQEGDEEGEGDDDDDDESEEARKKKDQAVMSRLRRVKSLFNTKGSKLKKLGASPSPSPGPAGAISVPNSPRPGTSHSTRTTETVGTGGTGGANDNAPAEK
ncbi:C3HC zinc finger-like-domain-containing protein [Sordaria brevicollis]|uniref:C3HC zinc finger-like-domain-containing protein n=1 Tax=Sordaria brevicollis TaxID=83679 RepID=A0AAE0PL81_SORBR|nr:C3HC zinc finger-like-domain-containing protein [Sordaria brevicollis]